MNEKLQVFLAKQPATIPCPVHPDVARPISPRASWEAAYGDPELLFHAKYQPCPKCAAIERETRLQRDLLERGVPEVLLPSSLDNWTPGNGGEEQHLESCHEFAEKVRKGFLILLGSVGTGKSHLAVGVMRHFANTDGRVRGSVFVKQSTLLRQLRATYSDKKSADPIEHCQEADLLVLDEMGLSGGGKDEWPMLSEILDFRYGHLKPTVITSNLTWEELRELLGDRIGDRMREAAHAVLVFSGASHRPEHRAAYFATGTKPTKTLKGISL